MSNKRITVADAYTQYSYGPNTLNYSALGLYLGKINHIFKGKHIGLPQIRAGLAGGEWYTIRTLIQAKLKDCRVAVVIYQS